MRVRVKCRVKEMVWVTVRVSVRVNIRFMMVDKISMRSKVRIKC